MASDVARWGINISCSASHISHAMHLTPQVCSCCGSWILKVGMGFGFRCWLLADIRPWFGSMFSEFVYWFAGVTVINISYLMPAAVLICSLGFWCGSVGDAYLMLCISHLESGERGGSVVECRTPEREVRGSRPTAAVLCPWARHFTPRKYWLITQEAMATSRHDWKIVDWDVKPQHNQPTPRVCSCCGSWFLTVGVWLGLGCLLLDDICQSYFVPKLWDPDGNKCLGHSLSWASLRENLSLGFRPGTTQMVCSASETS